MSNQAPLQPQAQWQPQQPIQTNNSQHTNQWGQQHQVQNPTQLPYTQNQMFAPTQYQQPVSHIPQQAPAAVQQQPQQQFTYQQQQVPNHFQQAHAKVQYKKQLANIQHQQELQEMESRIPKRRSSTFSSIEYRPRHVSFATQNSGEQVYLLVRRHWITNIGWFIRNTFLALMPPITLYILALFQIETDLVTPRGIFLVLLAYYSLIITNYFSAFFDWYFDPYILTNERIIGYDFKPFTSYSIKEATLDNIEDVKEISIGPIASIFNYGTIRILTASEKGEILFLAVPNPTEVRDIIADLAKIYKKYHFNKFDD